MAEENSCRKCRREGKKLFLKGERCFSPKCPFMKRSYAPGQAGMMSRKLSEYALQLREKQKMKRTYGLSERQFKNYFKKAAAQKGQVGENFLSLLETRLDNVVYRLGFASSLRQARQLTSHGHFLVNSKKVNIPSYSLKEGDAITIEEKRKKTEYFKNLASNLSKKKPPSWLKLDPKKFLGQVIHLPQGEELPSEFDLPLVIEFYSR